MLDIDDMIAKISDLYGELCANYGEPSDVSVVRKNDAKKWQASIGHGGMTALGHTPTEAVLNLKEVVTEHVIASVNGYESDAARLRKAIDAAK